MEQVPATSDGGSMLTTTRRVVWHTSEGDTFAGLIGTLHQTGYWPHYSWDPNTGEIAQHLSHDRAGRALTNAPGGCETNRWGALQVEVVGHAVVPFTTTPMHGLADLLAIFRAAGVPDRWPLGQPLPYPRSYGLNNGQRSISTWLGFPGHYGHSQVPENEHGDPGAVDIRAMFTVDPPTLPPPVPPTILEESPMILLAPNQVQNLKPHYVHLDVAAKRLWLHGVALKEAHGSDRLDIPSPFPILGWDRTPNGFVVINEHSQPYWYHWV